MHSIEVGYEIGVACARGLLAWLVADVAAVETWLQLGEEERAELLGGHVIKLYNTDQTVGSKNVWAKCVDKSKERVTAMLLAASDGTKTDPFFVFKMRASTKTETARENAVLRCGFRQLWGEPEPLQVVAQLHGNPAGWWNIELPIQFLYYHFGQRTNMSDPVLLLWNDFSGHWRQDVVIFARLINVKLMRVPPGYTYVCQPADVAWKWSLKNHLCHQWINFLLARIREADAGVMFVMTPPARQVTSQPTQLVTPAQEITPRVQQLVQPNAAMLQPNWGSLVRPFCQRNVAADDIDTARDIELKAVEDEIAASA
ncbi:hypothetical protein BBJ28_00000274 [Nothophytophthora sp. Chile5]|nr:hypothetical protein BBJ28_00000274 [Nothophytophthora sp. Chile5]